MSILFENDQRINLNKFTRFTVDTYIK